MTVHSKLVDGLTNATISPATENLQREIRQILQAIQEGSGSGGSLAGSDTYSIIAGPDQVVVTTTSKKLKDLGIVFKGNVKRVTLIPEGTNIYWSGEGKAKSGTNLLPLAAIELDVNKTKIEKFWG